MKLTAFKRIIVEDFDDKDQNVVKGLAMLINPIIDQLAVLLDKRLDFLNINRQLKEIDIQVDATGTPLNRLEIKSELKTKAMGINCIRVQNNTSSTNYPSSTPLISFSENQGLLNISNITNLTANSKYTLTLEIIGNNT